MQFKTTEELAAMSIAGLDQYFAELEAERLAFRAHAKIAKEIRDLRNRQANEAGKLHKDAAPEDLRLVPGVALANIAAQGAASAIVLQARRAGMTPEQLKQAMEASPKG